MRGIVEALDCELKYSGAAFTALAAGLPGTLAVIAATPLPGVLRCALLFYLVVAAWRAMQSLCRVRGLRLDREGAIEVRLADGTRLSGALRPGAFVAPWLTVVRWRAAGERRDRTLAGHVGIRGFPAPAVALARVPRLLWRWRFPSDQTWPREISMKTIKAALALVCVVLSGSCAAHHHGGRYGECETNRCEVAIAIDASGNVTFHPDVLRVFVADSHIVWSLPTGYEFCPAQGDGVFFKNRENNQFTDSYATDDGRPPPDAGCKKGWHWRDRKTDPKGTPHRYGVNFRDKAGREFNVDPIIINDM